MKRNLLGGREFYQGSGKVDWGRFVPWAGLTFLGSGLMALILFLLFRAGWYLIILVPILAALAIAALARLAVGKGHCRNGWMAGGVGLVAGLLLYFGYYYVGMVSTLGTERAADLALLPKYIRWRMATDVVRDVNDSRSSEERPSRRTGDSFMNWFGFSMETALVLGVTTIGAYRRARKPYCEGCGQWMKRGLTYFEPSKAPELMSALETKSARSLAGLCSTRAFATFPNMTLALEYCPAVTDGKGQDCPFFVSLKHVTANAGGAKLDLFEHSKGKMLVQSLVLSRDELPAMALRFSFLESYTGRSAVTALIPERDAAKEREDKSKVFAEIRPVEGDYAGRVLTRKTKLIGNALVLSGLLIVFASVGLMALGGTLAFPTAQVPSDVARFGGIALLVLGGVLLLSSVTLFLINPSYLGNRYLLGVIHREFARRSKCLVEVNDPEALIVEIVPKLNWGKMALDTASDVGFLRVDRGRKEVLFEGDNQRCRIPAAAITYCEVEYFVEGQGTHAARKIYYVVLRAEHPSEFWEAPIRERGGTGMFRSGRRKKAAYRLWEGIKGIREGLV